MATFRTKTLNFSGFYIRLNWLAYTELRGEGWSSLLLLIIVVVIIVVN